MAREFVRVTVNLPLLLVSRVKPRRRFPNVVGLFKKPNWFVSAVSNSATVAEGAVATEMAEQGEVPEEVKRGTFPPLYAITTTNLCTAFTTKKIGKTLPVMIDEIDEEGIIGRSMADAPEIDGVVYIDNISEQQVKVGEVVMAAIHNADEYDLWATI